MPEYIGEFAGKVCSWVWGAGHEKVFVSGFADGEVMIAAAEDSSLKDWVIVRKKEGNHADCRLEHSADVEDPGGMEIIEVGADLTISTQYERKE